MSPAWIRPRVVKVTTRNPRGKSFQVLYRRGGRYFPVETAGTFRTEREAKLRRDLVGGWLAAGLNPKDELARLQVAPIAVRTLSGWATAFLKSRIDIAESTHQSTRSALASLTETLGARDPQTVTVADLQLAIGELDVAASTVKMYVAKWRMLFEFAGVDPNPARSKQLRLPQIIREEISPPTADHFIRTLNAISRRYQLPLVVLEQTAMRVGEAETLTWRDVDESTSRFRLRAAATKGSRARWVQVPEWLMDIVSATCPLEDRTADRRVFVFRQDGARKALLSACVRAGVPAFTPHDLRHRRATIWHHDGLPVRVLMERGGWTRSDIPIEVYSHILPLAEADVSSLEQILVRTP